MSPKHERLVILSIPFARLARLLLSDPVLGPLGQHCDLVVVSPLARKASFQKEFAAKGMQFLSWQMPAIPRLTRAFLAVSELLRMHGYWRRFRKQGMAYYLAVSGVKLGADGRDERVPSATRMTFFIASVVGTWSRAWRVLDRLIGRAVFDFPELCATASEHRNVTLIQSASWGLQDRMLAWLARRYGWRTVMIPYTSDQLVCNGYLMSDFDALCVQGPFEERWAKEIHDVPKVRIVQLGSAWFRHLDLIAGPLLEKAAAARTGRARTILFAGVSPTYYPRESEKLAVEALLRGIVDGRLPECTLVYRPVVTDESARQEIERCWRDRPHLRLQWPQTVVLGLEEYRGTEVGTELREYVSQLLDANLVVMAGMTSMCLDAAQLGIPSVSYMGDPSGVLARRHTQLMFDSRKRFAGYSMLPVVHETEELIRLVRQFLDSPEQSKRVAGELAADWDYPPGQFRAALLRAVMG